MMCSNGECQNYFRSLKIGANTDLPFAADFNGDGTTDLGVFTPITGKWMIDHNFDSIADLTISNWGRYAGDQPLAGDFNGDGKTDLAIFRTTDHKWYFDYDRNGTTDATVGAWGQTGDKPIAGDWNNDNKDEIGVWRPSETTFYLYGEKGDTICTPNQVSGCKVCKFNGTEWQDDDSKCAVGQYCDAGICKEGQTCVVKTCATLGDYRCGDWLDGCGKTINCGACSLNQACSVGKCVSDCTRRAVKKCDGANVYWYNSCNAKEGLAQNCTAESKTCRDGACVSSGGPTEPQKEQPHKLTRAEILTKIAQIKQLLIQLIMQLIAELQKQLAAMPK